MRKLNIPFALALLLGFGVAAAALHFVHGFQLRRTAGILLLQADRKLQQHRYGDAVGYFQRYLALEPKDSEARATLAQALVDSGAHGAAFFTLDHVLREQPHRDDLRRTIVQTALRVGRWTDAEHHLGLLLEQHADDPELYDLAGQCQEALGNYRQARSVANDSSQPRESPAAAGQGKDENRLLPAEDAYRRAIELDRSRVETHLRLAALLRRDLKDPPAADRVVDQLVDNNPQLFRAWLARAAYRRQFDLPGADADARQALQLAPDEPDALLLAGSLDRQNGDVDLARRHLERGLALAPKNFAWYLELAQLESSSKRPPAAIAWLERGLRALPGNIDLLWNLADMRIQQRQPDRARQAIDQLRGQQYPPAPLEYLSARLAILDGQWLAASRVLERARPAIDRWPDLARQADFWLGQCYGRLEKSDLERSAYRRAVTADPTWIPARLGLASALERVGQVELALEHYDQIIRLKAAPKVVYIHVARLMILHRLRLSPELRDWGTVQVLLETAKGQLPGAVEIPLLEAEIAVAQNDFKTARGILAAARDEAARQQSQADDATEPAPPADPAAAADGGALANSATPERRLLLLALSQAALEQRDAQWDRAAELLDEVQQDLGDSAELHMARLRLVVQRDGDKAGEHLPELERQIDAFEPADQARLLGELAAAWHSLGDKQQAKRLWSAVAQREPDNVRVRLLLFDLALGESNADLMAQLLADIRRIEGSQQGPLWRYGEASRLILLARRGQTEGLKRARALLTAARNQRPAWPRIALLEAEIDALEEDLPAAIQHYSEAVDLGESNPAVVRRLVELLYREGQYGKADQVLRKLEIQPTFTPELSRLASEVSYRIDDHSRALEMAQRMAATSRDYRDHVWLGQLLLAMKRVKEAEKPFRDAVEYAPAEPAPWVALVQYLVRAGRTGEADKVIEEAQANVPDEQVHLLLAQCCEATSRIDEAGRYYVEALEKNPGGAAALRSAAEFYLRTAKPDEAEPHLRKLLDHKADIAEPDRVWARRNLAIVLASRGDYQRFRQAMALIDQNLEADPNSQADRRAKAALLSARPGRTQLQQAVEIFESLVDESTAADGQRANDRFLLAQLYQALGNWPEARRHMLSLLAARTDNAAYTAFYIRGLLARDEVEEAATWLNRLEKLEPGAPRTVELRARALVARGRLDDALALIDTLNVTAPPDPSLADVARLLEQLAQVADPDAYRPQADRSARRLLDEAEQRYRESVARQGETYPALAGFLARQARIGESLDVYQPGWQSDQVEQVAAGCVAVVSLPAATDADRRRVEQELLAALDRKPQSLELQLSLAQLRDRMGQYARACQVYRQVLESHPQNVVALNNLALLTALTNQDPRQALLLVNRAIEVAGPLATLLDSRASIQLVLGQADQAIADLEQALGDEPAASKYFHLAQANLAAGDRDAALAAFRKAQDAGLSQEQLHPLEHDGYLKLESALRAPNTNPTR